jgi:predicted enzyme related to lactoylglutathione lyase
MPEVTKYQQGTPSWLDLSTTDLDAAEKFYGQLFGWEVKRLPAGEGLFYSMQYLKGKTVAGMMEQSEEQVKRGMPPSWSTYIAVEDVGAAAVKAERLGGSVLSGPMDVFDNGRMAVIQDPEGALVFLWQANKHIGSELVNEPGTVIWNELVADDSEKAASFYGSLLDIEVKEMEEGMEDMPGYKLFTVDGKSVAGIFKKTEKMKELPSQWSIYFAVEDTDLTVAKAEALGGKVLKPAVDTPMGRFAVLRDPQGAVFQVISYPGG